MKYPSRRVRKSLLFVALSLCCWRLTTLPRARIKAAELLPKNARVHFEYGKLLQRTGQIRAAKEELELARSLDPKLTANLYALTCFDPSLFSFRTGSDDQNCHGISRIETRTPGPVGSLWILDHIRDYPCHMRTSCKDEWMESFSRVMSITQFDA